MKKLITTLTLCFGFTIAINAQCNCENIDDDKTYCYDNETFKEYCATFTDGAVIFELRKKKKIRSIPIITDATSKDLIKIAEDKKLKVTASDILFIQEALKVWKTESWNLGQKYTESGLGIKVLKDTSGEFPKKGQRVKVHYSGFLASNGKKFDSSVDRDEPFVFELGAGRVIRAWDEAVSKIRIGSKVIVKVPSELGYGRRGAGSAIPPNSDLFFEIEVLGIE